MIASDKTETEQNLLYVSRKDMAQVHNTARLDKKNIKILNSIKLLKTINFEVRKIIRY